MSKYQRFDPTFADPLDKYQALTRVVGSKLDCDFNCSDPSELDRQIAVAEHKPRCECGYLAECVNEIGDFFCWDCARERG